MLIMMTLLIFAAVTAAALAVYQTTVTARNPVTLRLRELRLQTQNTMPGYARRPPLLAKLIAQLGGFLPAKDGSDAMRTGLVRAGYRREDAVLVFLGSKVLCAVLLPIAWMAVGYSLGKAFGNVMGISILLGFVGFYLPTFFIAIRQGGRHLEIMSALPDALDLMVVCV